MSKRAVVVPIAAFAGVLAIVAGCGARTSVDLLGGPAGSTGPVSSSSGSGSGGGSSSSSGGSPDDDASACGATNSVDGGAAPFAPPSCAAGGPGLGNCGSTGESCCTSLEVPCGTYDRTYLGTDAGPRGGADPASVSAFRLDKYEVTVGRFRQFQAALKSGYAPSSGAGKHTHLHGGQGLANSASPGGFEPGWDSTDDGLVVPGALFSSVCIALSTEGSAWTGIQENEPINCVSWYGAYAFCIWDGGFLPSESEWEYAAAGGALQREYPWGTTAPGASNAYAIYGGPGGECNYPTPGTCAGLASIAPVGTATLGAGSWGQLDLAGSVREWALDSYASAYVDPCADCAYLTVGPHRVVRGGAWDEDSSLLPSSARDSENPPALKVDVGIRCARAP